MVLGVGCLSGRGWNGQQYPLPEHSKKTSPSDVFQINALSSSPPDMARFPEVGSRAQAKTDPVNLIDTLQKL